MLICRTAYWGLYRGYQFPDFGALEGPKLVSGSLEGAGNSISLFRRLFLSCDF